MLLAPKTLRLASADGAAATLHAQGAHLTGWTPAGRDEQLFTSARAIYAEGVAIRGGVPVIFPQFASEGPLPKHGFARTLPWQLVAQGRRPEGDASARYELRESPETLAQWPHAFEAALVVTLGAAALQVALHIRNSGAAPFRFTAALHSYLAVSDIAAARIHGLRGLHYRNSAAGGRMEQEAAESLAISGEVDRIYFDTPPELLLHDGTRRLQVSQQGFADTVVWNPGALLAARLADLAPEEYRRFVCIEAAAIQRPVALAPGQEWAGTQTLRLLPPG